MKMIPSLPTLESLNSRIFHPVLRKRTSSKNVFLFLRFLRKSLELANMKEEKEKNENRGRSPSRSTTTRENDQAPKAGLKYLFYIALETASS